MTRLLSKVLALLLLCLLAAPALAQPVLRAQVEVTGDLVTVGDLFDDAQAVAGTPLFRAPAPGTTGYVTLDDVRTAVSRIGLTSFSAQGIERVRVSRAGVAVNDALLSGLISEGLTARGILGRGMTARTTFTELPTGIVAPAGAAPVTLADLRYMPQGGGFSARFTVAGADPIDVSGRVEILIEAPHLAATLPAGTVLSPNDIEMRAIPLNQAEASGLLTPEQVVGKALQRQSRGGVLLRPTDIADPQVISRNELVTLYLQKGPLTLTAKGQALNAAAMGATVSVLNLASKKIIHGVAAGAGAVKVSLAPTQIAGL